jgi:hypothetical protein
MAFVMTNATLLKVEGLCPSSTPAGNSVSCTFDLTKFVNVKFFNILIYI